MLTRHKVAGTVALIVSATVLASPVRAQHDPVQEVLRFPDAQRTTKKFLDMFDAPAAADKRLVEGITYGIYWGVFWANIDVFQRFKQKVYCVPEQLGLRPSDVMEIVQNYVKSNQKVLLAPYGLTILLALRNRYPCAATGTKQ